MRPSNPLAQSPIHQRPLVPLVFLGLTLLAAASGPGCSFASLQRRPYFVVSADHVLSKPAQVPKSISDAIAAIQACVSPARNTADILSQRPPAGVVVSAEGIFARWPNQQFLMPWTKVAQVVPRCDAETPSAVRVSGLILYAVLNIDTVIVGPRPQGMVDVGSGPPPRLVALPLNASNCPAEVLLVAVARMVGPDRLVGCGSRCREVIAAGSTEATP